MNKKFVAIVSSVALLLAPATTVLASDTAAGAGVDSSTNNTVVSPGNETSTRTYTKTKVSSKSVSKLSVEDAKSFARSLGLNDANIVEGFQVSESIEVKEYTLTFENSALYKTGHRYKVHHFHYNDETKKFEEKEAPTDVAKNGKITVTLHGASPLLIEDMGEVKTEETKTSANGRKAALNTSVRY